MPHVLVIASSEVHAQLERPLRTEGFETSHAAAGRQALDLLSRKDFDLAVLDLVLPDMSGTELLRQVKQRTEISHVPIMVVTAVNSEIDRVVAFELGAVDYVAEPYSMRELVLRLRVAATAKAPRRRYGAEMGDGPLAFDDDARRAVVRGRDIGLSPREFSLLSALRERPGAVYSRVELRNTVWPGGAVSLRTVDAAVKRLRRKLGAAGRTIETVRGVGYRLHEAAVDGTDHERGAA
jgi:DNA-binding response OmpR family regulator